MYLDNPYLYFSFHDIQTVLYDDDDDDLELCHPQELDPEFTVQLGLWVDSFSSTRKSGTKFVSADYLHSFQRRRFTVIQQATCEWLTPTMAQLFQPVSIRGTPLRSLTVDLHVKHVRAG